MKTRLTVRSLGLASLLLVAAARQTAVAQFYVATSTPSVSSFPTTATGNVAPSTALSGGNTGFSNPYSLAANSNNLFVADDGASKVDIYSLTATGNIAPSATISGASTGLSGTTGIAIDSSHIYVANANNNSVEIFPLTATGNVAPSATISGASTGINSPYGLAVDANNIYVVNHVGGSVVIFPLTASGNVVPSATISGGNTGLTGPNAITVDSGHIYVAAGNSVVIFPLSANGNVTPSVTISGGNTGLSFPDGIAVDASHIYVANNSGNSVTIYPLSASGNAAPTATITGASTGITHPNGIALPQTASTPYVPPAIPQISGAPTVSATVSQSFSYQISASGSPSSYGASGLPAGLTLNSATGAITGTPTTAGNYTVIVTATGSTGTGTVSLLFTVAPAPLQPQMLTFSQGNVVIGSPPFSLNVSSSSSLPITITIVSGPAIYNGSQVLLLGSLGTVVVQVSQPGNATTAATTSTFSFNVVAASSPETFFGNFTTTTGQSAGVHAHSEASSSSVAATVNGSHTGGTIIGYIASLNAGFVANFTVGSGGAFQTTTTTLVSGSSASQTLSISGTLGNSTLTGTLAGLGLSFSLNVDPLTGPSSSVAGTYNASSLQSSSGGVYSIVGTQGEIFVLVATPTLVSSGLGTVANDSFTVQGSSAATIAGSLNPTTTALTGSVTTTTAGTTTFAGVASTTTLTDRLINLSGRGTVTPASPLTAGFVIAGTTAKTLVVRGIGPSLASFGLSGVLAHPELTLLNSAGAVLATNTGWGGTAALTAAFVQVGAFPLSPTSADSAIEMTLQPGAYTLRVSDAANDAGGIALAEVYDASIDPTGVTQKLTNLSSLGQVGTGSSVLDCGFVVSGTSPKQLLIRGVGPSLAAYGVAGTIADPVLTVYDGSGNLLATNNDWGTPLPVNSSQSAATAAQLTAAASQVGAFPLLTGSKDSALIVTLAPGAYTAQVTNAAGATGTGLVEIYELSQ